MKRTSSAPRRASHVVETRPSPALTRPIARGTFHTTFEISWGTRVELLRRLGRRSRRPAGRSTATTSIESSASAFDEHQEALEAGRMVNEAFVEEWDEETGDHDMMAAYDSRCPPRRPRPGGRRRRGAVPRRRRARHRAHGERRPFGSGLGARVSERATPQHLWAGARAHNRWLADFCADRPRPPHRRARSCRSRPASTTPSPRSSRAAERGLRGMLIPTRWFDRAAYHEPLYDPVWAGVRRARPGRCTRTRAPAPPTTSSARASSASTPPRRGGGRPARSGCCSSPACSSATRTCKYSIAENGAWWVPDLVERMDEKWHRRPQHPQVRRHLQGRICRCKPSALRRSQRLPRRIDARGRRDRAPPRHRRRQPHVGQRPAAPRGHLSPHPLLDRRALPRASPRTRPGDPRRHRRRRSTASTVAALAPLVDRHRPHRRRGPQPVHRPAAAEPPSTDGAASPNRWRVDPEVCPAGASIDRPGDPRRVPDAARPRAARPGARPRAGCAPSTDRFPFPLPERLVHRRHGGRCSTPGELQAVHYFGEDLVVYRTEAGEPRTTRRVLPAPRRPPRGRRQGRRRDRRLPVPRLAFDGDRARASRSPTPSPSASRPRRSCARTRRSSATG